MGRAVPSTRGKSRPIGSANSIGSRKPDSPFANTGSTVQCSAYLVFCCPTIHRLLRCLLEFPTSVAFAAYRADSFIRPCRKLGSNITSPPSFQAKCTSSSWSGCACCPSNQDSPLDENPRATHPFCAVSVPFVFCYACRWRRELQSHLCRHLHPVDTYSVQVLQRQVKMLRVLRTLRSLRESSVKP